MNGIQKVIKYCAMAFAIFLSVVILGTIVSVVMGVTTGIAGISVLTGEDKERINLSEEYSLEKATELGITSVLIDCNAEITVKRGDVLAINAENVTDDYTIRQANGEFSIVEENPKFNFIFDFNFGVTGGSKRETVVVTIPAELSTEQIKILSGSGAVTMTDVVTENLTVDSGSGRVTVENVTADHMYVDSGSGRVKISGATMSETEIYSGSGGVTVDDSKLGILVLDTGSGTVKMENTEATEANVDTGSGAVTYSGILTGTCEFETGSGALNLRIDGSEEEYRVKAECGSGTFRINGKKVDDGSYGSNVKGEFLIDSGSGSVNVEFNTPENE